MLLYWALKYVHIIGAAVLPLPGTGAGIAFFMLLGHRTGSPPSSPHRGDCRLALHRDRRGGPAGHRSAAGMAHGFLFERKLHPASVALYIVTGDFWLRLVWMQMRMRDLACEKTAANKPLSPEITACSGCGSPPAFPRLPLCWRSSG
jgi:uncharacterized membrane protein